MIQHGATPVCTISINITLSELIRNREETAIHDLIEEKLNQARLLLEDSLEELGVLSATQ